MQNASSYTVPKLVLANVLAVIMMLFEQHAPADMPQKPQSTVDDKAGNKEERMVAAAVPQPEAAKASVVPKKRLYKVRHNAKSSPLQLINANASGPVECCFRGYKG